MISRSTIGLVARGITKYSPALVLASAVLLCAPILHSGAPPAAAAERQKQTVKPEWQRIDLKGEVVDSWCFASRSVGIGRGQEHEACAKACAHGGVTLGIVDDQGKMYIAAKSKGYSGCQMMLEPFVAKRVRIIGMVATIGGCPILKINTVQELGADDKPVNGRYHEPSKQAAASHWVTPADRQPQAKTGQK